jgi:hypothetical protein
MANSRTQNGPDGLVLSSGDLASFTTLLSLRRPDLCVIAPTTIDAAALAVIGRQAELAGARVIEPLPATPGDSFAESRRLLDACAVCKTEGCERVVWPVWCAGEVDGIALALDRARLVSTLASLDARRGGVSIETPVLDLLDSQLAELAIDVGVPTQGRWLADDNESRWQSLMRSADTRRRQPA